MLRVGHLHRLPRFTNSSYLLQSRALSSSCFRLPHPHKVWNAHESVATGRWTPLNGADDRGSLCSFRAFHWQRTHNNSNAKRAPLPTYEGRTNGSAIVGLIVAGGAFLLASTAVCFAQDDAEQQKFTLSVAPEFDVVPGSQECEMRLVASIEAPHWSTLPLYHCGTDSMLTVDFSYEALLGRKKRFLQKVLTYFINELRFSDRAILFQAMGGFLSRLHFRPVNETDLLEMDRKGKDAVIGMVTNLKGTENQLATVFQQSLFYLRGQSKKNPCQTLLLFTDGFTPINQLITYEALIDSITNYLRQDFLGSKAVQHEHMTYSSSANIIGYGREHDPLFLSVAASLANGMYYNVPEFRDVQKFVADSHAGAISTVAHNILVEVEGEDGISVKVPEILLQNVFGGGIHAGNLQLDEKKDVLFFVKLPKTAAASSTVTVKFSFFNMLTNRYETTSSQIQIKRNEKGALVPSKYVSKHANRYLFVQQAFKALVYLPVERKDDALHCVSDAQKQIQSSPSAQDPFCQGLLNDLETFVQAVEEDRYAASKVLAEKMVMHFSQRSNGRENNPYDTPMKRKMREKFAADVQFDEDE